MNSNIHRIARLLTGNPFTVSIQVFLDCSRRVFVGTLFLEFSLSNQHEMAGALKNCCFYAEDRRKPGIYRGKYSAKSSVLRNAAHALRGDGLAWSAEVRARGVKLYASMHR